MLWGGDFIFKLQACWIRSRMRRTAPLSLVTGADSSHFLSLLQFLTSVALHEPDIAVRVYDLGLHSYEREEMERQFPRYALREFKYRSYPRHVRITVRQGQYAWKPIIVWETLLDTAGPVCWMDAGNKLIARVDAIRERLRERGFFSTVSRGLVNDWTHPGMLSYLHLDADWAAGKRNLSGTCVGFDPRFLAALRLAQRWRNGALVEKCIAPPGSNRSNHRQDQALLTVLAHKHGFGDAIVVGDQCFLRHQDIDRGWRQRVQELRRRWDDAHAQSRGNSADAKAPSERRNLGARGR
jgi:hypothetical protein